eukprot:652643-Amorphochlora_amoeboformis.AAC.1
MKRPSNSQQNNGQGGYPWRGNPSGFGISDPVVYYHGSELQIEWTNQSRVCASDREGAFVFARKLKSC